MSEPNGDDPIFLEVMMILLWYDMIWYDIINDLIWLLNYRNKEESIFMVALSGRWWFILGWFRLVWFGLVWFCWMEMMLWLMLDVVDRQTYLINWSSESVISRVSRRHQSRNAETVTNATPNAQRARSRQGTEFLDGMDVP
jgi:hypothetical protein